MADHPKPSAAAAIAMIQAEMSLLDTEPVLITTAEGRILAEDVFAARNVPSFRAAAMDGFACRAAEVAAAGGLVVLAGGSAGSWPPPLPLGHAAAISTGAPVPDGADCVIVREHAEVRAGRMKTAAPHTNNNIREIGEDIAEGLKVASAGFWLGPDTIAAIAASGHERVIVRRWPRIGLLTTGSELDPACAHAGTPDSNGPMIAAQLRLLGMPSCDRTTVCDDVAALDQAIQGLGAYDLIIATGGVSAGDHDLVRSALERVGARILLHGVAMRPGKPLLFARLPDGRPFFGLPGNPVAAAVGFRFFVMAALRRMLGLPAEQGIALSTVFPKRRGTTQFLRGRRRFGEDGQWSVDVGFDQRSHMLSSMIAADCWLRITDDELADQRVFDKIPHLGSD